MAIRKIVSRSITDGAVVAADVSPLSIDSTKLASNAVTNTKIATGAISTDKLDSIAIRSGMKNRIINGAMVIDQRNAGASVTATTDNTYTLDRWTAKLTQSSKYSVQQTTTAPTGFNNSIKVTSLSAYSVGASDVFAIKQVIEGYNIADLGFGTANAKTVTLSFWVQSSLTGTFGGTFFNGDGTRSYPFSYTISSANTWQQISITLTGDVTGTWLTTNGAGLNVWFSLGAGSTYTGTANTWSSSFYTQATGATSVVGTNGATFYIAGVQLEVGASATGYEYRQYGQELALCQRYYSVLSFPVALNLWVSGYSAINDYIQYHFGFPTTMRATPTLSTGGTLVTLNTTAPDFAPISSQLLYIRLRALATGTMNIYNSTAYAIYATAEL